LNIVQVKEHPMAWRHVTDQSLPQRGHPARLIGDKGYDSNPLRAWLAVRHIEPIIPARRNRHSATHQDGRKLRRYRKRWIIERTNAWLQNFRRLVVRYDRHIGNFIAWFISPVLSLHSKRFSASSRANSYWL
jgi:transposase